MAHGFKLFLLSAIPWLLLLFMGIAWGLSFSVARIAILNGGMAFGITFWQNLFCGSLLLVYSLARGRPLPMSPRHIRFYFIVAILGTSVPASCFYLAAEYVSAGVLAITVTLIPILTYGMALLLGSEEKSAIRMTGIACGTIAILMLVVPDTSLPDRAAIPWVLLACVAEKRSRAKKNGPPPSIADVYGKTFLHYITATLCGKMSLTATHPQKLRGLTEAMCLRYSQNCMVSIRDEWIALMNPARTRSV